MELKEWDETISPIKDDILNLLHERAGCGPFDGGCLVFAQALHKVMGGEVMGLARADNFVIDHCVLYLDGKLWDFDGPLKPIAFMKRFSETETPGFRYNDFVPFDLNEVPETVNDPALAEELSDLLRKVFPERTSSPSM